MQKKGGISFGSVVVNIKGLGGKAFLGTVFRGYRAGSEEQHPSPRVLRGCEHFRSDRVIPRGAGSETPAYVFRVLHSQAMQGLMCCPLEKVM